MKRAIIAIIMLATGTCWAQSADVRFTQDKSGRVLELRGLYSDANCLEATIVGTVVKRVFAEDGVSMTGFVLEMKSGAREFVNADIPAELDQITRGIVLTGLQTLLREGRLVIVGVKACGAAGRVQFLDRVN